MHKVTHPIQIKTLVSLVYSESLHFSELNASAAAEMTSDNFTFHLRKLQSLGLVEKDGDMYFLADKGVEYASRIDLKSSHVHKQPKCSISIAIYKDESEKEVLLAQRKYQPLRDTWGIHTEKMRLGDTFEEAIRRCLKSETGIQDYTYKWAGVSHLIRYNDGVLLADVVHNLFRIYPQSLDTLELETKEIRNEWCKVGDVSKKSPTTPTFQEVFKAMREQEIVFQERVVEGRI